MSPRTATTILLLVSYGLSGCTSDSRAPDAGDARPSSVVPVAPDETLAAGTKVTVKSDDGRIAHVVTPDRRDLYIPKSRLKTRSALETSEESYSHVLSADAPAYLDGPPAAIPEEPARPPMTILLEQMALNGMFLTQRSLQPVIAPLNSRPVLNGEKCWRAHICTNPDCPGVGQGDFPYFFINPNPGSKTFCPACRPQWEGNGDELAERYLGYAAMYELPESVERMKELDNERRRGLGKPPVE